MSLEGGAFLADEAPPVLTFLGGPLEAALLADGGGFFVVVVVFFLWAAGAVAAALTSSAVSSESDEPANKSSSSESDMTSMTGQGAQKVGQVSDGWFDFSKE